MKNTENSSIVVQWDEVDDSLTATYVVIWTSERDHILHHATLSEQLSYTITGLTLDTIYTIIVTAYNSCGQGPENRTSVTLTADTTPTMSPTVTTSITQITFTSMSSINSGTTTAVVIISASTGVINLSTTSTATTLTTTATNIVATSYVTPTSTTNANPANTTTADKTCKF